jgi:glycine/D-amino acid oxidase-like deaminating enzyme
MLTLPKEETSYWMTGSFQKSYPQLSKDISTDLVVVGGGITGLTTAYLARQAGLSVVVLEKNRIGGGTTGRTTGKVTSQHNIIYNELESRLGSKAARLYGEANQTAIDEIEKIIKKEGIDCGWRREDNFVFTNDSSQVQQFKAEAKTAAKLGLPAHYETNTPLPFAIKATVRFENQGKFNAYQYACGLATAASALGVRIFENSKAIRFLDGSPASVKTKKATVTADNIVVATNVPAFPLVARGAYCILEYPTTSYVVAGKYKGNLKEMYISPDDEHYSIYPVTFTGDNLVLVAGRDHIRGPRNGQKRFQQLADYAEKCLGVTSIEYMWSAWDYIAYDNVPLVGKLYPWSKHLYVATAFKKWGLAHSMVAATILRDRILGQPNPWAEIYDPIRTSPIKSIPKVAAEHLGIK